MDSIKHTHIIEIPEGEERKKGPENFPNMGKEIDIQVQKAQKDPNKMNLKRSTQDILYLKCQKLIKRKP